MFAFGPAAYADDVDIQTGGPDFGTGQTGAPEGEVGAQAIGPGNNGNIFNPYFSSNGQLKIWKDTNNKLSNIIRFADWGPGGQKWKVIINTTKGDVVTTVFKENGTGTTGCTKSATFANYREVYLPLAGNFAKVAKVKLISGGPGRYMYIYFNTTAGGDAGWRQTSGVYDDGCGW